MKLALLALALLLPIAVAEKNAPHLSRSSAFLAKRQSNISSASMKVFKRLKLLERKVDAQLGKDHAPKELRSLEQSFFREAERDINRLRSYKPLNASFPPEGESDQEMLVSFQDGMKHVMKMDVAEVKEANFVEGKAVEALKEMHADVVTQTKVKGLMEKVSELEKKQIAIAMRSLEKVDQTLASKSHIQPKTAVDFRLAEAKEETKSQTEQVAEGKFRLAEPVEDARLSGDTTGKLQEDNLRLVAENEQIHDEHDKLVAEMELKQENMEIRIQNAVLRIENDEMKGMLA